MKKLLSVLVLSFLLTGKANFSSATHPTDQQRLAAVDTMFAAARNIAAKTGDSLEKNLVKMTQEDFSIVHKPTNNSTVLIPNQRQPKTKLLFVILPGFQVDRPIHSYIDTVYKKDYLAAYFPEKKVMVIAVDSISNYSDFSKGIIFLHELAHMFPFQLKPSSIDLELKISKDRSAWKASEEVLAYSFQYQLTEKYCGKPYTVELERIRTMYARGVLTSKTLKKILNDDSSKVFDKCFGKVRSSSERENREVSFFHHVLYADIDRSTKDKTDAFRKKMKIEMIFENRPRVVKK